MGRTLDFGILVVLLILDAALHDLRPSESKFQRMLERVQGTILRLRYSVYCFVGRGRSYSKELLELRVRRVFINIGSLVVPTSIISIFR